VSDCAKMFLEVIVVGFVEWVCLIALAVMLFDRLMAAIERAGKDRLRDEPRVGMDPAGFARGLRAIGAATEAEAVEATLRAHPHLTRKDQS